MPTKTLLLFTLLFLSTLFLPGCVERGYELTVNPKIQTVAATKSVDIRDNIKTNTIADMDKMNKAVEKEQNKKNTEQQKLKVQKKRKEEKALEEKALLEQNKQETLLKKEEAQQAKNERNLLAEKQAIEKEKQLEIAQEQRKVLAEKVKKEKEESEKIEQVEKEKALQIIQNKKEKEILAKKLAVAKTAREHKEKEAKLALELKIVQEQKRQAEKEKKEKEALDQKIFEEKRLALALKEKNKTLRIKRIQQEKAKLSTTAVLNFKQYKQTYQKFGTSEIHGHVVHLSQAGNKVSMRKTKIYLVPKNTKTDYWYNNYYLKNKEAPAFTDMTMEYINATHLNLEKNFAFYGLAQGTYYIIIESLYPIQSGNKKKVYIAKKINVEKYKKIMTVFSKKL